MNIKRAPEYARTAAATASLAHLLLPILAGVLAPVLFAGGVVAVLVGVLVGFGLAFALIASGAQARVGAWWESYKRGYRIENVTAVFDMSDTTSPPTYVERTETTIRFKRSAPGIVTESREWSGRGQVGELLVTNGDLMGEAHRHGRTIQTIDLRRDFDAGDDHTYGLQQSYLDTQGDFEPFLGHVFDSAADQLRMLVRFAPGAMPSEDTVRVRGRGARREYDRAANTIALRVIRPRIAETYRLEWEPVAPRRPAAESARGHSVVLPSLLAMRYDCTARHRGRV